MRVEVEKTEDFGYHKDHFELNNPANTACEINSNSTHIFVDVPLNACGTQIEVILSPFTNATFSNTWLSITICSTGRWEQPVL